jgi:cytoskeletal protein RodZ
MRESTFPEMVRSLYRQQTTAFKIKLTFGFILLNIETGVLQYYHHSQNNASSEQKKTWRGCRLQLGGSLVVVTRYVAALGWVLVEVLLVSSSVVCLASGLSCWTRWRARLSIDYREEKPDQASKDSSAVNRVLYL